MTLAPSLGTPLGASAEGATGTTRPAVRAKPRTSDRLAWAVVATAVLLRLVIAIGGPFQDADRAISGDSPRYLELASNLLATGTFGLQDENAGHVHIGLAELRRDRGEMPARNAAGLLPETFRTPGYPAVIALPLALGLPAVSVLAIQALMAGALAAVVFRIGRDRLGRPGLGLAAAVVVALHPGLIAGDLRVLSEGPFALALWLGVWLGWPKARTDEAGAPGRDLAPALLGGLCLGLAALARPIAAPLALCIAGWRLVAMRKRARGRDALAALCIAIGAAGPVVAWSARNAAVAGEASLSPVPAINAWYYTAVHMDLLETGQDWSTGWPAAVAVQHQRLRGGLAPGERITDGALRLAAARFESDPGLYARAMARSLGKFTLDHSAGTLWAVMGREYAPMGLRSELLSGNVGAVIANPGAAAPLAWTAFNAALALAALVGGLRLLFGGRWREAALLGGLVVGVALATQTNGLERFRLPVIPAMALLAPAAFLKPARAAGPSSRPPLPETAVSESPAPARR